MSYFYDYCCSETIFAGLLFLNGLIKEQSNNKISSFDKKKNLKIVFFFCVLFLDQRA